MGDKGTISREENKINSFIFYPELRCTLNIVNISASRLFEVVLSILLFYSQVRGRSMARKAITYCYWLPY